MPQPPGVLQAGVGTVSDSTFRPVAVTAVAVNGNSTAAATATPDGVATINAINQRIFDTSPDLILVVDKRGTFLRVSPSASTILGYDPSELIGRSAQEILYPPDLDNTRNEMRLARHGGEARRNFECRYVHKTGRVVTLWWIGVWSEPEGQYFFIGRDVTERRAAEQQARESAARLAMAVEISELGLASAESPSEPAQPNEQFNRIYGFPTDKSAIGAGELLRLIHPDDRDRVANDLLNVIREGGLYRGEYRIRRADTGEERWVRTATQTVCAGSEDSGRFLGAHLDITDLKENARLLEAAMEVAQLGSWATDLTANHHADARFTLSPGTYRILGQTEDGFDNRVGTFWNMVHPEDRAAVIEARTRAIESGDTAYRDEFRLIRPDGAVRWIQLQASIIRDAAGVPSKMAGMIQDITDRRTVDERLRQAQRMDAIGQLTSGMAHDFNNLLGIILANFDLLRIDTQLDAGQQELVQDGMDAALRGADLTRRLLAFARSQELRPERIEVNALVSNTVTLLTRTLGEHIPIRTNLSAETWAVSVDPAQLESALVNLATNARDAMPRGGELTIATGNRVLDAEYAAGYSDVTPGEYAMIEVSDTGTGIPPDVLARVFEPFFTTKEQGKGTGLGLAMVFGFIKQSGGHVNVYSEVGKGTTFRLYLPRDAAGAVAAGAVEDAAPAATGGDETILVVEDNEGIRRAVRRQLAALGYRVLETDNATAALAMLADEKIVLLFTDVVMPGDMDGVELARAAMTRWPDLKVILTSGFPEGRLNGNGQQLSGLRLLSKPYRRADLARAVRDMLDAGEDIAVKI